MDIKLPKNIQFYTFLIIGILVFSGVLFIIRPFITTIVLTFLCAYLLYPVYSFFKTKTRLGDRMSSIVTVIIFTLAIILPFAILIAMLIDELPGLADKLTSFLNTINIDSINDFFREWGLLQINQNEVSSMISGSISSLVKGFANSITSITASVMMLITQIVIFYFLFVVIQPQLGKIRAYLLEVSPLGKKITNLYLVRSAEMSKSVILSSFLVAFIQAVIVGILLFLFKTPLIPVWMFITFLLGLVPLLGTSFITIPFSIFYIVQNDWPKAIIMLIIQILILANVDVIVRPLVKTKEAKIPSAVLLIGIVGGIITMGAIGLLYGPIIMILFTTTLEVYLESKDKLLKSTSSKKK